MIKYLVIHSVLLVLEGLEVQELLVFQEGLRNRSLLWILDIQVFLCLPTGLSNLESQGDQDVRVSPFHRAAREQLIWLFLLLLSILNIC